MEINEIVEKVTIAVKRYLDESKSFINILVITDNSADYIDIEEVNLNCNIVYADKLSYKVDENKYDFILLNGLSNTSLFKISNVSSSDNYTNLVSQLILSGKKLYVLNEGVCLFKYIKTAPSLYYKNLYKNIEILQKIGVEFLNFDKFCEIVKLKQNCINENSKKLLMSNNILNKKLVTLKDVEGLSNTSVSIYKSTIITDLAKDYMKDNNITMNIFS